MALTTKSTVTAQIPQLWASDLYFQAQRRTFWNRWEGPVGSDSPIIRRDDLTKAAGDTIKFDIALALTGAGVTGDTNSLSGNEEALKFRQTSMTVADLSNAVQWTELVERLINKDMRKTALLQLSKWLAEKIEIAIWNEIVGLGSTSLPTANAWFAGAATSIGTVSTAMYPTLNDISDLKAYAQTTLKIEPLRMEDGQELFGFVIHPYAARQLKQDSSYQQAQRDANVDAANNPLFTGAIAKWDNVMIFSSQFVPTANDGATSATVARNVLFGCQALSRGYAMYPDWREEFTDYGRKAGIATTVIKGEKLNVFDFSAAGDNSALQAIGSAVMYSSALAPTP